MSCGGWRLPFLTLVGLGSWEGYGRLKAQTLQDRLLEASTPDVPGIVKDMAHYRWRVDPVLREAYAQANGPRMHASNCTLASLCYHWTLARRITCTSGCSRGSRRKSS